MTDTDGKFTISGVPPGKYTLMTWNERYRGDPVEVDVKLGATAAVEIPLHR